MLEQAASNKTGWTRVAFGDVVRLSKARSKDPESEGYQRVVGLEHIDAGDPCVRRWADISEGTTFTSVFRPGQVLFGKRRAYLRKLAVANFSGVCSGDIYVLEPRDDALIPELLPFICQTDAFFEHAIATSAGSLSPRTNWKSLASFEFLLPTVHEQARIVEVLTAIAHVQRELYASLDALNAVNAAILELRMRGSGLGGQSHHERVGRFHGSWPLVALGELVEYAQYGLSTEAGSAGRYPMIRMMNLEQGRVLANDLKFIDLEDDEFERYRLDVGDVLFNRDKQPRFSWPNSGLRSQGKACLRVLLGQSEDDIQSATSRLLVRVPKRAHWAATDHVFRYTRRKPNKCQRSKPEAGVGSCADARVPNTHG